MINPALLALAATVGITVTNDAAFHISPYLASMSLVYAWAPDVAYSNGTMAAWASAHGIATARYPAGMASYWNWQDPSGIMGKSTFDPSFHGPNAPEADWMGLGEYLDLCTRAGMRPLIGVNYNCHRHDWVPLNESIARAVKQVQYVVSRGFEGAIWYIGNEDGAPQHASQIRAHAEAMKEVDPTLLAFYNDNALDGKALKKFLGEVGGVIDGAEFHGKWPNGGDPSHGAPVKSYTDWLEEAPLLCHRTKTSWPARIKLLRAAAKEAGRPDLLLANNEYGLGKPPFMSGFSRFTKSLVVVEFAMAMFLGGYDVAAFWDNGDGGNVDHQDHMLLDTQAAYRMNPMHLGLALLFESANTTMLRLNTTAPRVYGFAAREDGPAGSPSSTTRVYLINKFEAAQAVQIAVPPSLGALARGTSMVDTADHWGAVQPTAVHCAAGVCSATLPAVSFTRFITAAV